MVNRIIRIIIASAASLILCVEIQSWLGSTGSQYEQPYLAVWIAAGIIGLFSVIALGWALVALVISLVAEDRRSSRGSRAQAS